MPFSFTNKTQGDLIRSQDWNAAMSAIVALYDKINGSTGHRHTGGVEDGPQIGSPGLQDLAVLTQKLADLCVTTAKLMDSAVTNPKIAAAAVDGTKLANTSVNTAHIVNAAVDINKMAANSVGTNQIVNGAVTLAKMAANSVGSSQINDLSVSVNKIVDSSVTTAKVADGAITTAKVADGAITRQKIANGVAPEIGVAISTCSDQQYAAIPFGFVASECIFFGAFSWIYHSVPAGQASYLYMWHSSISSDGQVYFYNSSNHSTNGYVRVLTLAKKGGWF
jgi:hypothetical protein